jgi:xanthine dehydrogenase accessory factor
MNDQEIFQKIAELKDQGNAVCLTTIVEAVGSTPRQAGAKMIVCADGTTYGSIGGGCGESQVKSAALRCLLTAKKTELIEVRLLDDLGTKGGDVCGGTMQLFVERV